MLNQWIGCVILAVFALASQSFGAIIAFEAESGTLGANWTATVGGPSGLFIEQVENDFGSGPADVGQIVTYSVLLPADTYDLYARVFVDDDARGGPGNGSQEDSMYVGNGFGAKAPNGTDPQSNPGPAGDWVTINNFSEDQGVPSKTGATADGGNFTDNAWHWVNLTTLFNGNTNFEDVTTYTSAGATETFVIGNREIGLYIDAFAFATAGENPNSAALDDALAFANEIPEPSSAALLGLVALSVMRRRRARA